MAYGAADPTIVQAALHAAQASVPHDDSANMAIIRDAYKTRMDSIEGIFKKIEEQNELYNAEMEEGFKTLLTNATNGTHSSAVIDDVSDYIEGMRAQWKEIPRGKKGERARTHWKADFNMYASAFEAEKGGLDNLAQTVTSGGHNVQASAPNAPFVQSVINYHEQKTPSEGVNVATRYTEGNKIYYSAVIDGVTITKDQSELLDLIVPINYEMHGEIEKGLNDLKISGATLGEKYDSQGFINYINELKSLKDKKNYADFINTSFGNMPKTIKQEMLTRESFEELGIFEVLNDLQLAQYDVDGFEGIDARDFDDTANGKQNLLNLSDALTNIFSDNFDFKTSKIISAHILAAGEGLNKFTEGQTLLDAANPKKRTQFTPAELLAYQKQQIAQQKLSNEQIKLNEAVVRINYAIASGNPASMNTRNRWVKLIDDEDGKYWQLDGFRGGTSTKLDTRMIPFEDPNVDQTLMTHFMGEYTDERVPYTTQEQIIAQQQQVTDREAMIKLGDVTKVKKGSEMYEYTTGNYSSLEDANTRLEEARSAGFSDAVVTATLDGVRITLKQAKELGTATPPQYTVQLMVGKDIKLEMSEAEKLRIKYSKNK